MSESKPRKKWYRGWWWKLPVILIVLVVGAVLLSEGGSVDTCESLGKSVIQLSKKQQGPLSREILKLYDITTLEASGQRVLNCTATAKLNRGEDQTVSFYLEEDSDGDLFQGYRLE